MRLPRWKSRMSASKWGTPPLKTSSRASLARPSRWASRSSTSKCPHWRQKLIPSYTPFFIEILKRSRERVMPMSPADAACLQTASRGHISKHQVTTVNAVIATSIQSRYIQYICHTASMLAVTQVLNTRYTQNRVSYLILLLQFSYLQVLYHTITVYFNHAASTSLEVLLYNAVVFLYIFRFCVLLQFIAARVTVSSVMISVVYLRYFTHLSVTLRFAACSIFNISILNCREHASSSYTY